MSLHSQPGLHALYCHEQIAFFEVSLAANVLGALLREPETRGLADALRDFIAEEKRHTEMFRAVNRLAAPDLYAAGDAHFLRLPAAARAALDFVSRRPRIFPLLLWLMLLQEERALYFGGEFLRNAEALDPLFVETQRRHLADEAGHARCDAELLDRLWPRTHATLRALNARLLGWLVGEFFGPPKRASWRVFEQLAREFPDVRPLLPQLRREMLALRGDAAWLDTLYSRRTVPRTFARFDACPEFASLAGVLPGYAPASA